MATTWYNFELRHASRQAGIIIFRLSGTKKKNSTDVYTFDGWSCSPPHTHLHKHHHNTNNLKASIQRDAHQTFCGLVKESDPVFPASIWRSPKNTRGTFAKIAQGSREDSGSLLLLLPSSACALVMHSPESRSSRRGVLPSNLFWHHLGFRRILWVVSELAESPECVMSSVST